MTSTRSPAATLMCAACLGSVPAAGLAAPAPPNVLFIFVDDMGYGDAGCYGNADVKTPAIDSLAREGVRFTQFYVNAPLCSPSRVAVTTGQFPARWRINSYLSSRKANRGRGIADFLDPRAPSLARVLKRAGYATAHFGKWHMGGGRDVSDAPHPQAYGFDVSSVAFEGLGDRILFEGDGLSKASAALGQGRIRWSPKHRVTEIRVDQTIEFMRAHKGEPVYINLWLNDVHDPHLPSADDLERHRGDSPNPYVQKFNAVLEAMDRRIGRLLDFLRREGLEEKTLVIFTSDNGPTDWPFYYKEGRFPPGSAGPFRGRKWSLYEGGVRMPFIARWKGVIPAGRTDEATVACGADLFPTICARAGARLPEGAEFDGDDFSSALLGTPKARTKPLFWYYNNQPKPGNPRYVTPELAMRRGAWKLLLGADGGGAQLYDLAADPEETTNLAAEKPGVAAELTKSLREWARSVGVAR